MRFTRVRGAAPLRTSQAVANKRVRPARRGRGAKTSTVALIKRVMNGQLETKYVATQAGIATPLLLNGDITPSIDYISLCPPVALQSGLASTNVREGDRIEPIRAKANFDFWFGNLNDNKARTVYVKAFFVSAKGVKKLDPTVVAPVPKGLLEDGTATPVPWVGSVGSLQRYYPVCKNNYTIHKIKTIKLVQNAGDPISGVAPYPDGRSDRKSISFSWKPPMLKYGQDADTFPQNHAPMVFLVAYSPGFIYTTDASLVNSVSYAYQLSMTFKDA